MKWSVEAGNKSNTVTVSGNCVFTGKPYAVRDIPKEQWEAFQNGKLAQNAFVGMNADDREFLISGISPEGWEGTFGGGG